MKIPTDFYSRFGAEYHKRRMQERNVPDEVGANLAFGDHEIQYIMMMEALWSISQELRNIKQSLEGIERHIGR